MRRNVVSLVLLLFVLLRGPAAHAQSGPLAGLDAYIEQAMRAWNAPGLAIAVVKDDSVVFAKGYGVRELGKPERVDEHTVFAIASTTKAMTAATLGTLVDEDMLDWNDPVAKHLSGFQLFDPYVTREIAVRDLLTHRSGLARGDRLWWASPYSRAEVLQRVRRLQPSWSFRSNYGYQNIMFIAAGEVAAEVAGKSWDELIAERLFRPLGMTRTSTSIQALEGMDNVAVPHARIDDQIRPISWRSYDNLGGAGAVNSSAWDMAQWIRLNLGEGTYRGRRILSEAVVEEMQTPQTIIPADTLAERLYPNTHFRAYGLGWVLQDHHGRKLVQHAGALDGMRTQVGMLPEEKIGVVVITNVEPSNLQLALMYRVLDAFLGVPPRDWSADLLAVAERQRQRAETRRDSVETARVKGTRPFLPLDRYAGTYADSMYGEARIAKEGEKLVLRIGPAFTGDLEHWHYNTFRVVWRDPYLGRGFITFTLDASGKVDALEVEDWATFGRVPEKQETASKEGARTFPARAFGFPIPKLFEGVALRL